jgi:hypothetical protein
MTCWPSEGTPPHEVVWIKHDPNLDDIWTWMRENMGPHRMRLQISDWRWWTTTESDSRGDHEYRVGVCFVDPKDAMLFKLTWG